MSTTQSQQQFGIVTDIEYRVTHKRDRIMVWSGPFYSTFEAEGFSLPNDAGYMLTTFNGDKVRVECPSPRTEDNREEVDRLISSALDTFYRENGWRKAVELDPITSEAHVAAALHKVRNAQPEETIEEEPEPRTPRDWHRARIVGLIVSLALVVIDVGLLVAALTMDLWWHQ